MSLFDDVGRKLVETGQIAAQKTRGMTDTMKLNSMISEEERNIKDAFYQIGKKYCESFGRNPDQIFAQLVAGVRDSMVKIQAYTDQIKQIKGIVNCPTCGSEVSYESPFCSSCGSQMYFAQATSDSDAYCGNCGAPIAPSSTFCGGCGSKVDKIVSSETPDKPTSIYKKQQSFASVATDIKQCSACGNDLSENAIFCLTCGHMVSN